MERPTLMFVMYDRPNYPGGPIVNYLRLLPALKLSGYEVSLLSIYHDDYPNTRILQEKGIKTYIRPYSYTEQLVKWLLEKAEAVQPDVFIADVSTPACFAGKLLIQSGIPVINTHRSDDALNWGKAVYFSSPEFNNVLTGIVCVNKALEVELRNRIDPSPILSTVIPSGVPVRKLDGKQGNKGLRVVYAGRMVQKQKRVREMLESFLKLANRFSDVYFTLIGDGPELNWCIGEVERFKCGSRFNFTGHLVGEEYKQELSNHDVIVLLSDYEGTPGALMDGMERGLVPVCLNFKGCEELIQTNYNGIIVKDRKNSFQEAMEKLYREVKLRETLAVNARNTIIENFSLQVATERWEGFIAQCRDCVRSKIHFTAPLNFDLPEKNSMLPEYIFKPNLFTRIFQFLARVKKKVLRAS